MTKSAILITSTIMMLATVGCESIKEQQNPLWNQPLARDTLDQYYEPMIDNAVAQNMTVAECHFVPHTAKLNSLGVHRLDRIIKVLRKYGGVVRYETFSKDEEAVDNRLAEIGQHLAATGLEMSNVSVESKMSGGRGVSALEAFRGTTQHYQASLEGPDLISDPD
jgi:hypothetical protein